VQSVSIDDTAGEFAPVHAVSHALDAHVTPSGLVSYWIGDPCWEGSYDAHHFVLQVWDSRLRRVRRTVSLADSETKCDDVGQESPDGRAVHVVLDGEDETGMWRVCSLFEIESGRRIDLDHPRPGFGCQSIAFSPDGALVALVDADGVTLVNRATGKRRLRRLSGLSSGIFTRDGRTLLAGGNRRVYSLDVPSLNVSAMSRVLVPVAPPPSIDVPQSDDVDMLSLIGGVGMMIRTRTDHLLRVLRLPKLDQVWQSFDSCDEQAGDSVKQGNTVVSFEDLALAVRRRVLGEGERFPPLAPEALVGEPLAKTTCQVGQWLFPAEACNVQGGHLLR
jgi:hypothetical protein